MHTEGEKEMAKRIDLPVWIVGIGTGAMFLVAVFASLGMNLAPMQMVMGG
jgi:hypothetical protein